LRKSCIVKMKFSAMGLPLGGAFYLDGGVLGGW
jgi:hypothetical protein